MNQFPLTRRTFVTGVLCVGSGAVCRAIAGDNPPQTRPALPDSQALGGTERYLTYVSTEKPIYRGGETIYVRGVVLHHATHKPLPDQPVVQAAIVIQGPKGEAVAQGFAPVQDGVIGFSWPVPEDQSGGEYTVKIHFPHYGHTPAERNFEIRAYRAPRLKTQIKFLRDGYGPGDEVVASLHAERAEGGLPVEAQVTVVARVDDAEVFQGPGRIDQEGNGIARFKLPAAMARGEGTLAFTIDDGGAVETASRTIPILLQAVDLALYPEGGELVAGLPGRVYFEAFTPARKPADLAGVVVDEAGNEVCRFRSEHEGRGRFEFTPHENHKYSLKVTEPAGITSVCSLPDVKTSGATLRTARDAFGRSEPIRVDIESTADNVVATLSRREMVLDRQALSGSRARRSAVTFVTPESAEGVLTVTLWDSGGKPLAERLVFRHPSGSVRITVAPDAKAYSPGGKAVLRLKTTNDRGQPTSAVVGLTVTDDSVLEMIEQREQAARLPVMVFLESEVRDLADAHVYLDPKNSQAERAVDLLLGTQGWRRFALVDWQKFVERHQDGARRALALLSPVIPELSDRSRMFFRFRDELESARPRSAATKDGEAEGLERKPSDNPAKFVLARDNASAKGDLKSEARQSLGKKSAARGFGGRAKELAAGQAGRLNGKAEADALFELVDMQNPLVYVRVYAHELRRERQPGDRVDFTETLFWHAGLKTDERGEATVEFALNDSVTTFRAVADAFTTAGALGSATTTIESVNPFYLEPKLPLEVTQGDRILLPVGCVNTTAAPLGSVELSVDAKFSTNAARPIRSIALDAADRKRALVELHAGEHNGSFDVTIDGVAGPFRDKATRRVAVRPRGFPMEIAAGGLLDRGVTARHEIEIPADVVAGSFTSKIDVYPTPLASLTEALQSLIREPCGCFEQTSSTVYPLVMAQQYFLSHEGVPAQLIEQSAEFLNRGYDRLRGFECKNGGFEWFGADPGHDALTAYGLMEFTDMSGVRPVDPALLARTRDWLLAQRDGQGTFVRKTHTLHVWLAEPEVATAYNVWALLCAGINTDLATEINWIRDAAERTDNTYVMALAANVLRLAGERIGSAALLDRLAGKQIADGSLKGATVSVIGSTGEALAIETTALATLAWLGDPQFTLNVEQGIRFLAEQCKGGRFGSTQSTILALKAIIAYDHSRALPKAPGRLELRVDGQLVGSAVAFDEKTQGAISLPPLPVLTPGRHTVEIQMTGGSQMPYSMATRLSRLKPDSSEACRLHLEVALSDRKLKEGAVTEARVVLVNRSNDTVPTPTAIIGLPGGLEPRHDQLKELVKAGKIAAYEVLGREVVLYWRALPAEARVTLPLSLVAAIPGSYTAPASRAYLYYTNEDKHWTDGMQAEIEPQ